MYPIARHFAVTRTSVIAIIFALMTSQSIADVREILVPQRAESPYQIGDFICTEQEGHKECGKVVSSGSDFVRVSVTPETEGVEIVETPTPSPTPLVEIVPTPSSEPYTLPAPAIYPQKPPPQCNTSLCTIAGYVPPPDLKPIKAPEWYEHFKLGAILVRTDYDGSTYAPTLSFSPDWELKPWLAGELNATASLYRYNASAIFLTLSFQALAVIRYDRFGLALGPGTETWVEHGGTHFTLNVGARYYPASTLFDHVESFYFDYSEFSLPRSLKIRGYKIGIGFRF